MVVQATTWFPIVARKGVDNSEADRASSDLVLKSVTDEIVELAVGRYVQRYVFFKVLKMQDVQRKSAHMIKETGT